MASPAANFPTGMPGEPVYGPVARSGKAQAPSSRGPKIAKPKVKTVAVKAHTRTVVTQPKVKAPAAPINPDQSAIDAATRTHFAPQESALNQQIAQNTRYSSGLGNWYTNALDQIRGIQGAQAAADQQRLATLTNYASPATLANPADQQAANARNNLQAEFANKASGDAAANGDFITHLASVLALQQGNTLNQANAQKQNLIGQQGALGQQKADYATTYGGQLAQQESTNALKQTANDIAAKALGIKTETLNKVQVPLAKSLMNDRTAGERVARTNARTQRLNAKNKAAADEASRQAKIEAQNLSTAQFKAKYGIGPNEALNMTAGQWSRYAKQNAGLPGFSGTNGTKKPSGGYTPTQLAKYDNQWNGAVALAKHLKAAGQYNAGTKANPQMKPITRDVVYGALLKEYKNDPEFAGAAANIIFGQAVDDHDLHVLATKGVHPVNSFANEGVRAGNKIANALKIKK